MVRVAPYLGTAPCIEGPPMQGWGGLPPQPPDQEAEAGVLVPFLLGRAWGWIVSSGLSVRVCVCVCDGVVRSCVCIGPNQGASSFRRHGAGGKPRAIRDHQTGQP